MTVCGSLCDKLKSFSEKVEAKKAKKGRQLLDADVANANEPVFPWCTETVVEKLIGGRAFLLLAENRLCRTAILSSYGIVSSK
jgi:hypothetical protein